MTSSDLWERRYRYLESQLEAMLISTERSLRALEEKVLEASSDTPDLPRIRSLRIEDRVLTCVVDGADLEFRFMATIGGETALDTGYQRRNSVRIMVPDAEEARVLVRSRFAPDHVSSYATSLTRPTHG